MDRVIKEKAKNGILRGLSTLKGPLLIFFIALYFYFLAGKFEEVSIPGQLGPAFWPKAILLLLMFSCGIKALEIIFSMKKEATPGEGVPPPPGVNLPKLLAMITLVIAVVLAIEVTGFLLANFFFLVFFMRVAGWKKKAPLLLTSALGTIALLYLFIKVVYLPLPKGYGFFYDLTIFFYRGLGIF